MNEQKRSSFLQKNAEGDNIIASRLPIILWVLLVAVVTMILQNMTKPLIAPTLFFIAVILVHIFVYYQANYFLSRSKVLYLLIQGTLIFGSALILPEGMPAVLIGLIPILIGQSLTIYYETNKIVMVSLILYLFFCLIIFWLNGSQLLPVYIPMLLLLIVVVVAYALLFYRQVNARVRTQTFLRDLELAHRKVEELTLANERQRMARDLHDTLAQGLAALIMQLEAVDVYLGRGNSERAHSIVLKSMGHARQTLADARRAIDDLRKNSNPAIDFNEAVQEQVLRFNQATGIVARVEGHTSQHLSGIQMEHLLHILSESLFNIARHAHASSVHVNIRDEASEFYMAISDNGRGFNTDRIGRETGHYGLIGLYERARLIGGTLQIQSDSNGTRIEIGVPTSEEEIEG